MASVSFAPAVHANFLTAISRDFGLDLAGSSLYLSLNFWGALAAVVVAGPLAVLLGSRRLLLVVWVLEGAGVALIGFAPTPMVAYAGVLLASLSYGAISVLVPHLVSGLYPERRGRAVSLLVSFFTLGAVVGNTLVLGLFAGSASWRVGYYVTAALGLPWGVMLAVSGVGVREGPRAAASGTAGEAARGSSSGVNTLGLLVFLALCLAQLTGAAAEVSTSLWIPTFLTKELGATPSLGPVGLLLFCVLGAVGKLANSVLLGRVRGWILVATGLALFAGGVVMAALAGSVALAIAGFCLVGLGTGGFVPTVTVGLSERFPDASAARYSLFMAVGTLGPIAGPVVVAMVAGGNLRSGMLAMIPAAALCALLLLIARRVPRSVAA